MAVACFRCKKTQADWGKMHRHYEKYPDHLPTEEEKQKFHMVACRYCGAWLLPQGVTPHEARLHPKEFVPRTEKLITGPRRKAARKIKPIKVKGRPAKVRGFGVVAASKKALAHRERQERLKAAVKARGDSIRTKINSILQSRIEHLETTLTNLINRKQRIEAAIEVLQEEITMLRGKG